jgi:lysophospholipase L1-like esterase
MTHNHTCELHIPRPRRLSARAWKAGVLLAALVALAYAALHIPPTSRIWARHEVQSFLTTAPVLLLGDSISYASGPGRLCDGEVFNAAIPGAKLKDLLGQGTRIADRIRPAHVVVAIGVNDAIMPHLSIEEWTNQLRTLLAALAGADITLVEINPVDARFPVVARYFDQDFITRENAVIRELAALNGARLVPAPRTAETSDGLHPNTAGAVLWRDRLAHTACAA